MSRKFMLLAAMALALSIVLSSCFLLDLFKTDLQKTIDKVVNDVLPQLTVNKNYVCTRAASMLGAGSIILGDGPGSTRIVLKNDSYFFLLDLEPGAYFAHPVKYIIVQSGQVTPTVVNAEWVPTVNGEVPTEFTKETPDTNLVIARNISLSKVQSMVPIFKFPVLSLLEKEAVIVVQGLMSTENLYTDSVQTYNVVWDFFQAYKTARPTGTVDVYGLSAGTADNILTLIDSVVEGHSIVTIYIIAHGNVDWIRLGGIGFTASQFKTKMQAYPSVKFNFLLGSCHGGSFINDLNTLSNVRTVLTACESTGGAYPDWDTYGSMTDYNSSDIGSEWTSSVFERADAILNNTTNWNSILTEANTYKVPTTSVLLYRSHLAALGSWDGYTQDLDLVHRAGVEYPQSYKSW